MDEDAELFGPPPRVRRLCVVVAGAEPGLLAAVCRTGFPDRLLVTAARSGVELAVAPPGVDEPGLVRDLVATLRERAADLGPDGTVLLGLHVGIIRVVADRFDGAGIDAVLEMAADAVRAAAADRAADGSERGPGLLVVMADGLYADLRAEGLVRERWRRVPGRATSRFWRFSAGPRRIPAKSGDEHTREQECEPDLEHTGHTAGADG
jgi:hypothetical protein